MTDSHWSRQKEIGGRFWKFRVMLALFRFLGPAFVGAFTRPMVLITRIFNRERRLFSQQYLDKVTSVGVPSPLSVGRHFQSFASSLVDKMAAWAGILNLEDLEIAENEDYPVLLDDLRQGRGVVVLASHLGNIEMLRALGSLKVPGHPDMPNLRILAIVEFDGTGNFNAMLEALDQSSMEGIIPVSDIGPDTMIRLKEFVEDGGMVVIAGDRTSSTKGSPLIQLPFLGTPAFFPYGSYLLADLLGVPVYAAFALRKDPVALRGRYRFHVRRAPFDMGGPRKSRNDRIHRLANFFVTHLEALTLSHPYQWFNFYPFWERTSYE